MKILLLHAIAFAIHRTSLLALDAAVHKLAKRWPPLPTTATKPHSMRDKVYLAINSIMEHAFLFGLLSLDYAQPSLLTVVHFYGLFWLDDILYSALHRALHTRHLYRAVHAHHHAERCPKRGYADAGNEHPVEQVLALGAHFLLLRTYRFDFVAVAAHLGVKAVGSCCNHVDYAVHVPLGFGVAIDTAYHREHHQRHRCNYAQFVSL